MVTCPECGQRNAPDNDNCEHCGAALPAAGAGAPSPLPESLKRTVLGMPPLDGEVGADDKPNDSQPNDSQSAGATTTASKETGSAVEAQFEGEGPSSVAKPNLGNGPNQPRTTRTLLGVAAPERLAELAAVANQGAPSVNSKAAEPTSPTDIGPATGASRSDAPSAAQSQRHTPGTPSLGRTIIGGVAAPTPTPAGDQASKRTTRIGHGAPGPAEPITANAPANAPAEPQDGATSAGRFSNNADPARAKRDAPSSPVSESSEQSKMGRTILGVAQPGIAPLNPGVPKSGEPAGGSPSASSGVTPTDPQAVDDAQTPGPRETSRREEQDWATSGQAKGNAKGGWVLVGLAGLLLVAIGAFSLLWKPPRPLQGEVVVSPDGSEVLKLRCDDCADGTKAKLRTQVANFVGQVATLRLEKPLNIGANQLQIALKRPGIGRDEEVLLDVPVRFRIAVDLTALSKPEPGVLIKFQAEPGVQAKVDGQAVELANGSGELTLPVSKQLIGDAARVQTFEKNIQYAVQLPDGTSRKGSLRAQAPITPLMIEAPGASAVVDSEHFTLAGRTAKGGVVTVAGKPITVDPEGRFAQLMRVDSVGKTEIFIRSSLTGHAPRLVRLAVQRVASLQEVARPFRAKAKTLYDSFAGRDGENVGQAVAVRGRIEESRIVGHTTIVLLDVEDGCARGPCLARVVLGERKKLEREAELTVYGHLTDWVQGPRQGRRVPEVRAEFVIP